MTDLNQLGKMSPQEMKALKDKTLQRKAELEALKAKGGKDWNDTLQAELDNLVIFLVDVEEAIETKAEAAEYVPEKGTEKHIHLLITRGHRFDPRTGKPLHSTSKQIFSFSEWQLFKKNYARLGWTIDKVLHDPYNEAAEYVTVD